MPIEESPSNSEEIKQLKRRLSHFETENGRLSGLAYVPKFENEIIITTSPKAGMYTFKVVHLL
jgi:hypothetical protein